MADGIPTKTGIETWGRLVMRSEIFCLRMNWIRTVSETTWEFRRAEMAYRIFWMRSNLRSTGFPRCRYRTEVFMLPVSRERENRRTWSPLMRPLRKRRLLFHRQCPGLRGCTGSLIRLLPRIVRRGRRAHGLPT